MRSLNLSEFVVGRSWSLCAALDLDETPLLCPRSAPEQGRDTQGVSQFSRPTHSDKLSDDHGVYLSWMLGGEPTKPSTVMNDAKGGDDACPSCHHHVRQAGKGRRACPSYGRPLPHRAARTRLPAIRSLSECP